MCIRDSPGAVAGLHVDVPGLGQDHRLRAPGAGQVHGALRAAGLVVVGTHQHAGERQRLAADRREVAQRLGAALALDVGRRHQQGAAYLVAHPALGLGRPQRHCHITQAVRDQHHRPGLAADLGVQLGDPVGAQRGDPVLLLDP